MSSKAAKAYANNEVDSRIISSDSRQLVVLVFERVLDNLKIGKGALENGEYGIESFTKAHDLIQQGLLACLDYSAGKEIAMNLLRMNMPIESIIEVTGLTMEELLILKGEKL